MKSLSTDFLSCYCYATKQERFSPALSRSTRLPAKIMEPFWLSALPSTRSCGFENAKPCVPSSPAASELFRGELVLLKASTRREVLICNAETALAWQTPGSYRQSFNCWRRRGVGVNDLLNMTWSWLQGIA